MTLIILFGMCCSFLPAENIKLPAINSLKELPIILEADFSRDEAIASPAMPVISKDGIIFFFDFKLKQLYKTHLKNRALTPISREGEGPQEYSTFISGMFISGDFVYLIDSKGKMLCFGTDGFYKWEEAIHKSFNGIKGKIDDKFYLEAYGGSTGSITMELLEWTRGKNTRLIKELPLVFSRGRAIINGKLVENGGFFFIMSPVFSITGDWLISNASPEYKLDFLNLKTNESRNITVTAPKPELNEALKKNPNASTIQAYSIIQVYEAASYIISISNYFFDQKPRMDFFTLDGKLAASYLAPFKMEDVKLPFTIQENFLIYSDPQETGFKIYSFSYTK